MELYGRIESRDCRCGQVRYFGTERCFASLSLGKINQNAQTCLRQICPIDAGNKRSKILLPFFCVRSLGIKVVLCGSVTGVVPPVTAGRVSLFHAEMWKKSGVFSAKPRSKGTRQTIFGKLMQMGRAISGRPMKRPISSRRCVSRCGRLSAELNTAKCCILPETHIIRPWRWNPERRLCL